MTLFKLTFSCFLSLASCILIACAGIGNNGGGSENAMGDAPCSDCGDRGEIELEITDEVVYREWNESAFARLDSSAILGVFPAASVTAVAPENCKFCHSFSEDAIDFDLSRVEDSIWLETLPNMRRELMFPGMQVPEEDSTYVDSLLKEMLKVPFVEGEPLDSVKPWVERDGIEQAYSREVPPRLKNILNELATRYHVRYVSLPLRLSVQMDTNLGKKGGFYWESLWSLWDARYGELVFLTYNKFTAATKTRIAPERMWAEPMAMRLKKMLTTDLKTLEAH